MNFLSSRFFRPGARNIGSKNHRAIDPYWCGILFGLDDRPMRFEFVSPAHAYSGEWNGLKYHVRPFYWPDCPVSAPVKRRKRMYQRS